MGSSRLPTRWAELVTPFEGSPSVNVAFDLIEEFQNHVDQVDEVDVLGLYPADVAAAASRVTACDPGSGPTRIDD